MLNIQFSIKNPVAADDRVPYHLHICTNATEAPFVFFFHDHSPARA